MIRRPFGRLAAVSASVCLFLLVFGVVTALATHFRGGSIFWERILTNTDPTTYKLRITLNANMRWTYPSWTAAPTNTVPWGSAGPTVACAGVVLAGANDQSAMSCPPLGAEILLPGGTNTGVLEFNKPGVIVTAINGRTLGTPLPLTVLASTGYYQTPLYTLVKSIVPTQDVMYDQAVYEITIPKANVTAASPLLVKYENSNRLSQLTDNNADSQWRLQASINLSPDSTGNVPTRSPSSSSTAVIQVVTGTANVVPLPTAAYDNTTTKVRLATSTESLLNSPAPVSPSAFSLDPNTGTATFTPRANLLYGVQYIIESYDSDNVLQNSVPLELIYQAVASSPYTMSIASSDTVYSTPAGTTLDVPITATATPSMSGAVATIGSTPLSPSMTLTGTTATAAAVTATLHYTPTASEGSTVVCFIGTYQYSSVLLATSTQRCLTFRHDALATQLTMPAVSGYAGDIVTVPATLTRTFDNTALISRQVIFTWDDDPTQTPIASILTDNNGIARLTLPLTTVTAADHPRQLRATFNPVANEFLGSSTTTASVTTKGHTTTVSAPATGAVLPSVGYASQLSTVLRIAETPQNPVGAQTGVVIDITAPGGAAVADAVSATDASGIAVATFAPAVAGTYAAIARFAGNANLYPADTNGTPAVSAVSNFTVGQRVQVDLTGPATAYAGAPVTYSLSFKQLPSGAPLANRTVSVNLGSGASPASQTVTTDASGTASVIATYSTAATITATASPTLTGTEWNRAGANVPETSSVSVAVQAAPTTLSVTAPANGTSGANYVASAVLNRTVDPVGPVANASVTFTYRTPTNGLAGTRTGTTDANGRVQAQAFTLTAAMVGAASLTVTATTPAGLAVPTAVVVPITVSTQPSTQLVTQPISAVVGSPTPISATATDAGLLPLVGLPVTFVVGTQTFGPVTTNGQGIATVTWTPTTTQTGTYTVSYDGSTNRQAAFSNNTFTVVKASTQVTLTAPATVGVGSGATVTARLTRTVAPLVGLNGETVTITLTGTTTVSQSAVTAADGSASVTFPASALPLGSYALAASYAGTATAYLPSTSTPASLTVTDGTPPVITPTVTGTQGTGGWYTSDVAISWSVSDNESALGSQTGCGAITVTTDGAALSYTCSAQSAGGSASQTVTIKRDASAPIVVPMSDVSASATAPAGAHVSYPAVNASDATSGVSASSCSPASGALFALGQTTVTCTATNGAGLVATSTFKINVTNTPPTAVNDVFVTNEDTTLTGNVLANDTDVDSPSLTAAVVSLPAHGTVTLNANGTFNYVPVPDYNGTDAFSYKANDGIADSGVATVSITIAPVNDAPTVAPQFVSTDEDTPVAVTLAGGDIDGDALTLAVVTGPAHGTLSGSGAALTYTPAANYSGPDSFTFKANDGALESAVATVTIGVAPVNDPPVAANDGFVTSEDTALTGNVLANDTDVDSPSLTAVLVGGPAHGTLTLNPNGSFTYAPAANYNGSDGFSYKANDGAADSGVATVSITITAVNDAPTATAEPVTTSEDTPVPVTLAGADVDGDALTFAVVTGPAHGTLSGSGASLIYTPAANFNGQDTFTFHASDGSLSSGPVTVVITVAAVDDPPVATNDAFVTSEDTALMGNVLANDTDIDSPSLTAAVVSGPAHGTLTLNPDGSFSYVPAANYNGTDAFTYKANDGTADSGVATVSIAVTAVNDAPTAASQAVTTNEDTPVAVTLAGADVDGDALTFAVVSGPTHGTLAGSGATLTYTPAANYNGPDSFTFRTNDGSLNSDPATVTIGVAAINDPPVAANDGFATNEDTALTGNVLANDTDIDSPSLTAVLVSGPSHGALTLNPDGSFSYVPAANYNGTDAFTYKANDGIADSGVATVNIAVNAVNDAPTAASQSVTTNEDTPAAVTLTGADIDGDALTFAVVTGPAHGTLSGAGAALTYRPAPNYNGPDSFTFRASDGSLASDPATVTINVTAVNDAPIASAVSAATSEDAPVTGVLAATDVDGDALAYTIVTNGAKGTAVITNPATGAFTYTPNANANGSDTFTFKVNDGKVDSNVAVTTVTIAAVNDAPVAAGGTLTTSEDTAKSGTLVAIDIDSASLTYSVVGAPAKGTVVVTNPATGAYTYTPNANANGADAFTFKANDGALDSGVATVSITITPVNDAPVAVNDAISTFQSTAVTGNVLTNDVDVDGNTLTAAIVVRPTHGSVTLNANGSFTYTPSNGYRGADSFTYRASDGSLTSNVATVAITVNRPNRAPDANDDAVTVNEDTVASGNVLANDTDADGQTLTAVLASAPGNGTVVLNPNGSFTYTPTADFNGTDHFTYRANDGYTNSGVATVTITVRPVNDAPVAVNDAVSVDAGLPAMGNVLSNDSDVDSSSLTASLVTAPAHGTLTLSANGAFTYRPAAGFAGTDAFTYRVSDGQALSNVATVTITVLSQAQVVAQAATVILSIDPSLAADINAIIHPVPPVTVCQAGVNLGQKVILAPQYSLQDKLTILAATARITVLSGCGQ